MSIWYQSHFITYHTHTHHAWVRNKY